MVISHNLCAMNAQRQYGLNNISRKSSTEKLSSGYKINRAADDAAGLAISEKMRRQVRGLTQAKYNIQDGVGLCQVKDGALNEVHDLLQRMNELSVKSANGTLSPEDRSYIQHEVDNISAEINRIGKTTTFNEIPIFDYDNLINIPGSNGSHTNSTAIGTGYLTDAYYMDGSYHPSANLDFGGVNAQNVSDLYGKSFSFTCSQACPEAFKFTFIDGNGSSDSAANLSGSVLHEYKIDIHGLSSGPEILNKLFNYVSKNMPNGYSGADTSKLLVSHSNYLVRTSPTSFSLASSSGFPTEEQAKNKYASHSGSYGKADCTELAGVITAPTKANVLAIQAGSEAGQYIYLTMEKMNAKLLDVDPLDVSTQDAAGTAIGKVKNALATISSQRSTAGAEQNRLEHAYNVNDITVENTTAAESLIRDTDMAKEMVNFSLKNILAQAGESMMAQANQMNQSVLSLLQ